MKKPLIISGPKGSGKTQLANAICDLSYSSMIVHAKGFMEYLNIYETSECIVIVEECSASQIAYFMDILLTPENRPIRFKSHFVFVTSDSDLSAILNVTMNFNLHRTT